MYLTPEHGCEFDILCLGGSPISTCGEACTRLPCVSNTELTWGICTSGACSTYGPANRSSGRGCGTAQHKTWLPCTLHRQNAMTRTLCCTPLIYPEASPYTPADAQVLEHALCKRRRELVLRCQPTRRARLPAPCNDATLAAMLSCGIPTTRVGELLYAHATIQHYFVPSCRIACCEA